MQNLPHKYQVHATTDAYNNVTISSTGLSAITSAQPKEFGGSGTLWSPETLLVAAVADCFALSFKIIAQGYTLPWLSLDCTAEGMLDKRDKNIQFTEFHIQANLVINSEENRKHAEGLLAKAKELCLITNSLKAECHLNFSIDIG